jgi:hypothetical protein
LHARSAGGLVVKFCGHTVKRMYISTTACASAQTVNRACAVFVCRYNSTARASQLGQLAAALPQLSEVSLGYFGAEESPDVDAAAPGWPGLPLRALDFDSNSGEFRLGGPALDALGRLGSCLTQLALSGGVLVETTPTGAMALASLSP